MPNKGKLKIDATIADQQIAYPTDSSLLINCRIESERILVALRKGYDLSRSRYYPRLAYKESINFLKKKKPGWKAINQIRKSQLQYLKRNLGIITRYLDEIEEQSKSIRFPLPHRMQRIYWAIQQIYTQQKFMYDNQVRRIDDRIVNIYQPYVRPMKRGKAKTKVEFGSKISASETDGMMRIERLSWDAFNEKKDLKLQVEKYKELYKRYPAVVLADQIYLTIENRKYLKSLRIKIVGKSLGRPPKKQKTSYEKNKEKKLAAQRNHIEGKFGQGKNKYGLNKIKAKRSDTSESWIGSIAFVMNLVKLLKTKLKLQKIALMKKNNRIQNVKNKVEIFQNYILPI